MVTEYTDKVEKIVNKRQVGLATYQNQWRFPINKAKDAVASDFSLKGKLGKTVCKKVMKLFTLLFVIIVLHTGMNGRLYFKNTKNFWSSSTGVISSALMT